MSQEVALGLAQHALWVAVQVAAPLVVAGLIVGLVISVFQAATQIQDQALAFIPKVLALAAALWVTGGWILTTLVDFTRGLFLTIPNLVR